MVGFTCYLWNIDRSLWIAARLKEAQPQLKIVMGGPEITPDNQWVLDVPAVDFAVIGEGEQTFAELLAAIAHGPSRSDIAGLWSRRAGRCRLPPPLARLDDISSPYLHGILDAADEKQLLLETTRGCVFRCRFCYYPKSYDRQYFLSRDKIVANLQHARQHGAEEVFLLDPTLNQRRDFAGFLRLLADGNPRRQFTYSAELRAEGIDETTARLLREANFAEVEIGLQSVDRRTQQLMDRPMNLKAFERGTRAMLAEGIRVRIDLIIGLPGDTVDSVRRGIDYLKNTFPDCELQVFNLSILPGTSFRQDAVGLQVPFQPRPPYYVLGTPTLALDEMVMLMEEAQEAFGIEFDRPPPPQLDCGGDGLSPCRGATIELDDPAAELPPAEAWARSLPFAAAVARFSARLPSGGRLGPPRAGRQPAHHAGSALGAGRAAGMSDRRPVGRHSRKLLPYDQLSGPLLQPAPEPPACGQAAGRGVAVRGAAAAWRGLDRCGRRVRLHPLARRSSGRRRLGAARIRGGVIGGSHSTRPDASSPLLGPSDFRPLRQSRSASGTNFPASGFHAYGWFQPRFSLLTPRRPRVLGDCGCCLQLLTAQRLVAILGESPMTRGACQTDSIYRGQQCAHGGWQTGDITTL